MIIIIYREYLYDLNKYMESKSKIIVYLITNLYIPATNKPTVKKNRNQENSRKLSLKEMTDISTFFGLGSVNRK